jgi:hypothetical protein
VCFATKVLKLSKFYDSKELKPRINTKKHEKESTV